MDLSFITDETIRKAAEATFKGTADLKKTIDLSSGLTGFNLESPAKLLVEKLAEWRQTIPRRTIGGSSTNWRRITAVTPTGGFYAAEGTRSSKFTLTTDTKAATFRSYGRLGDVTWEGVAAGRNFEDVRAREQTLTLLQVLQEEELEILGGNRTILAAAGPTPTVVAADAGGTLASEEYFVTITALTLPAAKRASGITRVPADYKVDCSLNVPTVDTSIGTTDESAEASDTVATEVGQITVTWTAVKGAAAYGVYVGIATGNANLKLQAVTTQTKIIITEINTTGATAPTADTSADTKAFDGIIPQLTAAGSGAYVKDLNAQLAAAVGTAQPDVDNMIVDIYDRTKLQPDRLVMGWQEKEAIDRKLASVTNDRIQLTYVADRDGGVRFSKMRFYPSPIDGRDIPMESVSNIPGGMILGLIDSVPYPNSEVPNPWEMHMANDMVRLDYAITDPKEEFEVRSYGCLAGYFPTAQGIIYNIHSDRT